MTNRVPLLALLTLLILAPSALAQFNVKMYREGLAQGGNAKAISEAHISGAGIALEAANIELQRRHQPPLFCTPTKFTLTAENFESIIKNLIPPLITGQPWEKVPIEMALLTGLIEAFPCPGKP